MQWSNISFPGAVAATVRRRTQLRPAHGPGGGVSRCITRCSRQQAAHAGAADGPADLVNKCSTHVREGFVHTIRGERRVNLVATPTRTDPGYAVAVLFDPENDSSVARLFRFLHAVDARGVRRVSKRVLNAAFATNTTALCCSSRPRVRHAARSISARSPATCDPIQNAATAYDAAGSGAVLPRDSSRDARWTRPQRAPALGQSSPCNWL